MGVIYALIKALSIVFKNQFVHLTFPHGHRKSRGFRTMEMTYSKSMPKQLPPCLQQILPFWPKREKSVMLEKYSKSMSVREKGVR